VQCNTRAATRQELVDARWQRTRALGYTGTHANVRDYRAERPPGKEPSTVSEVISG
jgi:hypothetical protein